MSHAEKLEGKVMVTDSCKYSSEFQFGCLVFGPDDGASLEIAACLEIFTLYVYFNDKPNSTFITPV